MRPTQDHIVAVCATAATFLPDTDHPAAPRELICAVDTAIERRYEDEHLSPREFRWFREAAVQAVGPWSTSWTRKALAGELRDVAREGLDLAELVGASYAHAAGRIWFHGAYTASRVMPILRTPRATGLSASGRPWINLWMAEEHAQNPSVLRAEFAA